ncbi:MAG TPA: DUF2520 domain-containing protein [Nitriliruptorales bacterium]|nr:DUF2520 domain-containing protein [Nitriliruptorales bacterium]
MGSVAVVGPGRVGTVLAAALEHAGHRIVAVAGGGPASQARFADRFPGMLVGGLEVCVGADLVVITTPDDAVPAVARDLAARDLVPAGQRVVHVAGSLGLQPLRPVALAGGRVAACHPAQTVPDAAADPSILTGAAWAVTAAAPDRRWAHELVERMGGVAHDVDDGRRVLYHAGLVIASNAVAAAVSVARQLLSAARIDDPEPFLAPLVARSVDNSLRVGARAITGPVRRGDAGTLRRHLAALDGDAPHLAAAYRSLNQVVLGQVRAVLQRQQAEAVAAALAPTSEGRS